jgi:hypothetical protein
MPSVVRARPDLWGEGDDFREALQEIFDFDRSTAHAPRR